MNPTLLLVEDDDRIARVTARNLEAAGFSCLRVADGLSALREFDRAAPAAVILDVMLPGLDGLEVTRRIRRTSPVPILMLTARDSEGDKVLGLEVGADDYLTKPFSTRELIARVRALLRRTAPLGREETLVRGNLRIDIGRRSVELAGHPLQMTSLEFDVLSFMARHPGRVFSREALMDHVWGEDRIVDTRSIDSLVSRLRRKLGSVEGSPEYIQTVWGAGYRFSEMAGEARP